MFLKKMPVPLCRVNPLQGTDTRFELSNGNTYPAITRPWGMTAWAPQTSQGNWFFEYRSPVFRGIRATHQASPWLRDYGHFLITPLVGRWCDHPQNVIYPYDIKAQAIHPHVMQINLPTIGTTLKLTPTDRCALMQLTLPTNDKAGVRVFTFPGKTTITLDRRHNRLLCTSTANNGAVPDGYAMYFIIEPDCLMSQVQTMDANGTLHSLTETNTGEAISAIIHLSNTRTDTIHLRIGTSFISHDQAMLNMQRELAEHSFDTLVEQAATQWNDLLCRIDIQTDNQDQANTFYSCLYRCLLFPRKFYEFDAQNKPVHYSPYDNKVHPGMTHTDNGFWDTYRTLYPLLTVLCPEILGQMLEGWLHAYRQGGWLPKWACPGYLYCMVGTHAASVLADAAVKGITGFDKALALEAMIKDATVVGDPRGGTGRLGVAEYLKLGYVASDKTEHAVARTLDFAYNDFCIAQLAEHLGKPDIAAHYRQQAQNYRHLYDAKVGFMRAKNSDSTWVEPFEEFAWSRDYIEGGPWQSSWMVPHDPQGLIALMGGPEKVVAKLEEMMTMEPVFTQGGYGKEIHEMTEMALAGLGQYAQSNQPVHHILPFFTEAGKPDRTSHWVHTVLTKHYHATPDGLPGDEDNGEMSAWYVLNALGFFPLCPGQAEYHLVRPLFDQATIHLENGRTWIIHRVESSTAKTPILINDEPHDHWKIDHATITAGGTITYN